MDERKIREKKKNEMQEGTRERREGEVRLEKGVSPFQLKAREEARALSLSLSLSLYLGEVNKTMVPLPLHLLLLDFKTTKIRVLFGDLISRFVCCGREDFVYPGERILGNFYRCKSSSLRKSVFILFFLLKKKKVRDF